jgi:predicted nucleic acid-binding protein
MNIFLDANICLDLLDTKRRTSKATVNWYLDKKDDVSLQFYFSSDFITTFYYALTERKKINAEDVVKAIEAISFEIIPFYLNHNDFVSAKNDFKDKVFDDFEDLMILNSALRCKCDIFVTNDIELLKLYEFASMKIISVK